MDNTKTLTDGSHRMHRHIRPRCGLRSHAYACAYSAYRLGYDYTLPNPASYLISAGNAAAIRQMVDREFALERLDRPLPPPPEEDPLALHLFNNL